MNLLRHVSLKRTGTILFQFQRCMFHHLALTGIQPSGSLHLGNYLGAVKPCVKYCKSNMISKLYIIIADLHALTSTKNDSLSHRILELASTMIAYGLGERDSKASIFLQSQVRGHTELSWILATCCSIPRLTHLPQWREKSGYSGGFGADESCYASVGLFTYPVLQASDILLYGADVVPVGSDQVTHIELARDLVRTATFRWPKLRSVLKLPKDVILEDSKILSLRDPTKKMSKSDPSEMGTLFLTDCPDVIRQKVRRAQTDSIRTISYDPDQRPGVSNLLRILALIRGETMDQVLMEASNWNKEELKSRVTDAVLEEFGPIRHQLNDLLTTPEGLAHVQDCLQCGADQANLIAQSRLHLIYEAVGCSVLKSVRNLSTEQVTRHRSNQS